MIVDAPTGVGDGAGKSVSMALLLMLHGVHRWTRWLLSQPEKPALKPAAALAGIGQVLRRR